MDKRHHVEKQGKEDKFDKHHQRDVHGKEQFNEHHHEASGGKETKFHTKAKDHSSHADKAAAKAKFKAERRFQKLFSKMGSMDKQGFNRMDREDISDILEDVQKVYVLYDDGTEVGLPISGHQWLKCQFFWWVKAQPQRMLYQPAEDCLQYLAPWQLNFVQELHNRLQTGECHKIRKFSCIDPEPDDHEDYYKYVCVGDADYKSSDGDGDQHEGDDDRHEESHQPKGRREAEHGDEKGAVEGAESHTESGTKDPQRVNHTAERTDAFYVAWMEGRDNLRAEKRQADWMFDRASERENSRQREHRADWVFERAAERDASRENEMFEGAHNGWKKRDKGQQRRKGAWHGHREKGGHFKKDHGENHGKQHGKDFRQKYGRTSFCDSC